MNFNFIKSKDGIVISSIVVVILILVITFFIGHNKSPKIVHNKNTVHHKMTKNSKLIIKDVYNIKQLSYDESSMVLSGKTTAKNGAKILASSTLKDYSNENIAYSNKDYLEEFATVKNGKFKVAISLAPLEKNNLMKPNDILKYKMVAVENYHKSTNDSELKMLSKSDYKSIPVRKIEASSGLAEAYNKYADTSISSEETSNISSSSSEEVESSQFTSTSSVDSSKNAEESKEDLKSLVGGTDQKERYLNLEEGVLDAAKYDDINDGYSASKAKEFSVRTDNITNITKSDAEDSLPKADKKILTKEDLDTLTDYKKKLSSYFNNLHDYAVIYQTDMPVINKPDTPADLVADTQGELQEYQNNFEQAKQEWIAAYDAIMNS